MESPHGEENPDGDRVFTERPHRDLTERTHFSPKGHMAAVSRNQTAISRKDHILTEHILVQRPHASDFPLPACGKLTPSLGSADLT
jgi:hypothetical protein